MGSAGAFRVPLAAALLPRGGEELMIQVMNLRLRAIAALIAVAAIVFVVYRNHHHGPVLNTGGDLPIPVLVAKGPIQQGTAGLVIAKIPLYRVEAVRVSQIRPGAFVDPSALRDKAALTDIASGEQLTATEFGHPLTAATESP